MSNSGPHGQKAIVDEFEQLKWEVWQQFNKVPRSAHRIPAQMILASTHQVAVGTLHRVIEARTMPVHVFCWKEAVQRCVRPPEACQACKLKTVCCDRGSPARRAGGFIAIKDLEDDASRSDVESWRTQAECEEPGVPAGRIYHEYAEPGNLIYEALVLENRTLDLTADFNVHPIVWEINQVQPSGEVWAIDEICLRGVGTKQAAQEFVRRYKGHPGGYRIYGDATGSGRSTKTDQPGVTDYTMMREVFKGLEVDPQLVRWRVPEENPRRRDRYNAMNGMFCNLQGERRLKVHATKCPMLRSDLKYGAWQGGSMVEDESDPDRGHAAAAEGYYISRDYPALGAGARPVARPVGGIAGAQVRGIQQAYGGR